MSSGSHGVWARANWGAGHEAQPKGSRGQRPPHHPPRRGAGRGAASVHGRAGAEDAPDADRGGRGIPASGRGEPRQHPAPAARRGVIYDRNGVAIADNSQNYRIVIVREDAGDVEEVVRRLRRLVPLDETDLARALRELERRSPFVPVTLADRLSWEDFARVAANAPALPGITPEVGLSRHYPMAEDFAHIVGYVGPVSDYDLSRIEDPDPLLQIPKFQIGKVGVETKLEDM